MSRALKTLLALVLAALLPLRAVAGVTVGFCADGHQEQAVAAHATHGDRAAHGAHGGHVVHGEHGSHAAQGAHAGHGHHPANARANDQDKPAKPITPTCSVCAEHCSSAAFAPGGAPQQVAVPAAAQFGPGENARAALPYYPDQLDRPPLS